MSLISVVFLFFSSCLIAASPSVTEICKKQIECSNCCIKYSNAYVDAVIKKCSSSVSHNYFSKDTDDKVFILGESRIDSAKLSMEVYNYECRQYSEQERKKLRKIVYDCLISCSKGKENEQQR